MTHQRYAVPAVVAAKARACGAIGERWLRDLPETVAFLERAWDVRVGSRIAAGTASFVARAVTLSGQDVIVKIAVPDGEVDQEVRTLAAAQGHGYVRLLAGDPDHHALLLEPLGPSLDRSGIPPAEQAEILGALLRLAWEIPRDPDEPVRDKASQLAAEISGFRLGFGEGVPDAVVEYALACARRRAAAFDPRQCVRLHGDPAPGNALRVNRPRPGTVRDFVLIDPSGFTGAPAYDAGVGLRDWSSQLLAASSPRDLLRACAQRLAAATGLDPVAIWEWAFVERVSTGLYCRSLGQDELARPFLDSAARLVG